MLILNRIKNKIWVCGATLAILALILGAVSMHIIAWIRISYFAMGLAGGRLCITIAEASSTLPFITIYDVPSRIQWAFEFEEYLDTNTTKQYARAFALRIPLWWFMGTGITLMCASYWRRKHIGRHCCSYCGYDLRGTTSERCSECGASLPRQSA